MLILALPEDLDTFAPARDADHVAGLGVGAPLARRVKGLDPSFDVQTRWETIRGTFAQYVQGEIPSWDMPGLSRHRETLKANQRLAYDSVLRAFGEKLMTPEGAPQSVIDAYAAEVARDADRRAVALRLAGYAGVYDVVLVTKPTWAPFLVSIATYVRRCGVGTLNAPALASLPYVTGPAGYSWDLRAAPQYLLATANQAALSSHEEP